MRQREILWSEVTVGLDVTLLFKEPRGSGVSGTVEWVGPAAVKLVSGTARVERVIRKAQIQTVVVEEYLDADECLDWRSDGECEGPVDYRWVGGSHGRAWPRCERHGDRRQARYEASELERYAHSDVAPPGFDPADWGERWDPDDP